MVEKGLKQRDYNNGRASFSAARCAHCHHFDGDGGPFGPDLTSVAGRFSARDLVEKLANPIPPEDGKTGLDIDPEDAKNPPSFDPS